MPSDDTDKLYDEPFHQTVILTRAPLDALASRLILEVASDNVRESGADSRGMVTVAPLHERVELPDWKPETLEEVVGTQRWAKPGAGHPLENVTGGPDITVEELREQMMLLVASGTEKMQLAEARLREENSLHNARQMLLSALTDWTRADLINNRLYSIQFGLQEKLAQQKDNDQ